MYWAEWPLTAVVIVNFGKREPPESWMELPTSCWTIIPKVTFPAFSWSHDASRPGLGGRHGGLTHAFPQIQQLLS